MTIAMLSKDLEFPDPNRAGDDGLVAIGGDLSVDRLRSAYRRGVFPWPISGMPVLTWFSPNPRMVLPLEPKQWSRTIRRALKGEPPRLTFDHAFDRVVLACARAPRPGHAGTWITPVMRQAYGALHRAGHAHSVEAWRGDRLVAGLYGVAVGGVFSAESMFHLEDDASKFVLASLVLTLRDHGFSALDAQVSSPHLLRYGGEEWPRPRFLELLAAQVDRECLPAGSWKDIAPTVPGIRTSPR